MGGGPLAHPSDAGFGTTVLALLITVLIGLVGVFGVVAGVLGTGVALLTRACSTGRWDQKSLRKGQSVHPAVGRAAHDQVGILAPSHDALMTAHELDSDSERASQRESDSELQELLDAEQTANGKLLLRLQERDDHIAQLAAIVAKLSEHVDERDTQIEELQTALAQVPAAAAVSADARPMLVEDVEGTSESLGRASNGMSRKRLSFVSQQVAVIEEREREAGRRCSDAQSPSASTLLLPESTATAELQSRVDSAERALRVVEEAAAAERATIESERAAAVAASEAARVAVDAARAESEAARAQADAARAEAEAARAEGEAARTAARHAAEIAQSEAVAKAEAEVAASRDAAAKVDAAQADAEARQQELTVQLAHSTAALQQSEQRLATLTAELSDSTTDLSYAKEQYAEVAKQYNALVVVEQELTVQLALEKQLVHSLKAQVEHVQRAARVQADHAENATKDAQKELRAAAVKLARFMKKWQAEHKLREELQSAAGLPVVSPVTSPSSSRGHSRSSSHTSQTASPGPPQTSPASGHVAHVGVGSWVLPSSAAAAAAAASPPGTGGPNSVLSASRRLRPNRTASSSFGSASALASIIGANIGLRKHSRGVSSPMSPATPVGMYPLSPTPPATFAMASGAGGGSGMGSPFASFIPAYMRAPSRGMITPQPLSGAQTPVKTHNTNTDR